MTKAQLKQRIDKLQTEVAFLRGLRQQQDGVTVEPAPVLTDEQAEVLEFMVTFSNPVGWWFNNGCGDFWQRHMAGFKSLFDIGYLANESEYTHDSYQITDKGRAALEAHQALIAGIRPEDVKDNGQCTYVENVKGRNSNIR